MLTKVFTNGNSQAVRIPAEYRLADEEVVIRKVGSTLILFPKEDVWSVFSRGIDGFSDDFSIDRMQPAAQSSSDFSRA